jgi:hypothetical protein
VTGFDDPDGACHLWRMIADGSAATNNDFDISARYQSPIYCGHQRDAVMADDIVEQRFPSGIPRASCRPAA